MQTITLAFVEQIGYDYDISKALVDRVAVAFELDVARVSPVTAIAGVSNVSTLVDGSMWQIPSGHRKKQSFTTFPNMEASGVMIDGKLHTYKSLLLRWAFARSRWIETGAGRGLYDTTVGTEGLVKVILGDELSFEALENKDWAQTITIDIETMAVY